MNETIHATSVAIEGNAVLIFGRSGSGKSDLALRLIDRGAKLVSDDYTIVSSYGGGQLLANAPDRIKGRMEVRGVGLVEMEPVDRAPVLLAVDLDRSPERLPEEPEGLALCGLLVPVIGLSALEPSAPLKVELALRRFGSSPS
jgi:serine kinase of HPr protein (carbohydrate metabolism regulator)